MLHNNDPYGSSEPQLNMGASVNMNINSPHNIANGYNNIGKPSHEAPQTPAAHYNLPNYGNYGHSLMSPHPMHSFQNFQSNVFQPSFMHSAPPIHESNWSPILPAHLNAQADNMNYYERKELHSEYRDQNLSKTVPLNVPHVYPKPYKEPVMHTNYHSYPPIAQCPENIDLSLNRTVKPPETPYNLDLSTKTPMMDETRRRSLENTVKMIENILIHNPTNTNRYPQPSYSKCEIPSVIHSTKEINKNMFNDKNMYLEQNMDKEKNVYEKDFYRDKNLLTEKAPIIEKPVIEKDLSKDKNMHNEKDVYSDRNVDNGKPNNEAPRTIDKTQEPKPNEEKDITEKKPEDNPKSIYSCSTENSIESELNSDERNNNIASENEINESNTNNEVEKITVKVEPQITESDSEDMISLRRESNLENGEVPQSGTVEVKIEKLTNWDDLDGNPFLKDVFGVTQVDSENIIVQASLSVTVAEKAIYNAPDVTTNPHFYECSECGLYFSNPKRFLIHHKWHSFGLTNEKRWEEKMEQLKEREMLRNQRKEERQLMKLNSEEVKDGEVIGEVFKCNSCEKVFVTRSSLKNHKIRFHKNRTRECRICQKSFTGFPAWRAHLKTHVLQDVEENESRYQCNQCDKRFKYSHSLVKHKDTHLEKTMACQQCPKLFGSKALLNVHMKTHERHERGLIYHCTYCGKGFFDSYTLQIHERTHRNERPFICTICNTSFGTNSGLQRHLKVSHSSAKPWQCATCHRNFVSEKIRDRHVLRYHTDQAAFKFECTLCPHKYTSQKDLNKHMHKNHPKPGRRRRGRKKNDAEASGDTEK